MKNKLFTLIIAASACYFTPTYALPDLTGTYKCTGTDTKDGKFTAADTMQLDKKTSTDKMAGYLFKAPEFEGGLTGYGIFDGKNLAVEFHSLDKSTKNARNNYGIMLAHVTKNSIHKIYYEPVYKGGSTGSIKCTKISDKVDISLAKK